MADSLAFRHPCETCAAPVGSPCIRLRSRGNKPAGSVLSFLHESRQMLNRFSSGVHGMPLTNPGNAQALAIDQALARGCRVYEIMRDLKVTEGDVYKRMDKMRVDKAG